MEQIEPVQKHEIANGILIDSTGSIIKEGTYSGSIILKLKDNNNSIIFSDNIEISDGKCLLSGLKVGVKKKKAIASHGKFVLDASKEILYAYQVEDDIIQMFDSARFTTTNYPYMISLLNTSLLYRKSNKYPVNHIDFVSGEILNHPISLLYKNSIILGDRLVIDEYNYPIFYDSILINTNYGSQGISIECTYEPIRRVNINFIKYIVILGTEMLK